MSKEYDEFIRSKIREAPQVGFEPYEWTGPLFDFQKELTTRAIRAGRYAIFADCGLGKTLMQLEWQHQIKRHTGGRVLIVAPLAVRRQTQEEAEKFGYGEIEIINYESLHNVDPQDYAGVVLDESSILKNYTGKTKQALMDAFARTHYKLACTATPSPNDEMEMGNHAEFLGVMTRNEMLAMYFVHDGGQTSKWRLKKHARKDFYAFISSWASMISSPSDIGCAQDGYELPELRIIAHPIQTDKKDNGELFQSAAVNATGYNEELRRTKDARIKKAVELASESDGPVIVWCHHNDESAEITNKLSGFVEIKGSDKPEQKETALLEFGHGTYPGIVTKPKIAQYGLNYQNCHKQVFASVDFSFESLYQAIRRSYRFGQKHPVEIHLIVPDTMANVTESIERKHRQFDKMKEAMGRQIMTARKKKEQKNMENVETDQYKIMHGDCVERIKDIPDHTIGMSVFSPPFSELYVYSDDHRDMGNSKDYKQFHKHFGYLVTELKRVMMPGRNVCVHCMDLPIQKGKEGFIGLRDFSGQIREAFENEGFVYHSRVTIWKDPVVEMQRTKALGLLHKQLKKDSAMSRVGIPDYVLVFRAPGENAAPIKQTVDVDTWQKWASPVWYDINYSDTLNARQGRAEADEKHICPLQLPTIERLISLWSNHGDTVFTPFMGIGSEVYQAVMLGRYGIGIELKESYFTAAIENLKKAELETSQEELFA